MHMGNSHQPKNCGAAGVPWLVRISNRVLLVSSRFISLPRSRWRAGSDTVGGFDALVTSINNVDIIISVPRCRSLFALCAVGGHF